MQTGNISNIKQDVMFQLNIAAIEYNIAQKITIKTVCVTVIGSAYSDQSHATLRPPPIPLPRYGT